MSFGNRSSFATLSDAYGIPEFSSDPELEYKLKQEDISTQPDPITEAFDVEEKGVDIGVSCDMVKKHCSSCGCMQQHTSYGPVGNWLNEILNLILIGVLLWIIISKPII